MSGQANAAAGVDYAKIIDWKKEMVGMAKRTKHLPNSRGVYIIPAVNAHAVAYEYRGQESHLWVTTKEGLGNRAWIAMLLNQLGLEDPTGQFHFGGIGIDTFLMGANDNAAHGAWPVILTDEVSCGSAEFFKSPQAGALARSFERACVMFNCAMGQGESPVYKYLMHAYSPVTYAPSLSVAVIGIASPRSYYVSGEKVRPGDVILGAPSSGLHSNGISPVIQSVMELPDGFLTKLNGWTVGQEALIATRSYIGFVKALMDNGIDVHAFLPMTGGGIGKFGSDDRFDYKIHSWPARDKIPPLFRFMSEVVGMSDQDIAETFNCGIGYSVILPSCDVEKALEIGATTKIDGEDGYYDPMVLGTVEKEGIGNTYFSPWKLNLSAPGK